MDSSFPMDKARIHYQPREIFSYLSSRYIYRPTFKIKSYYCVPPPRVKKGDLLMSCLLKIKNIPDQGRFLQLNPHFSFAKKCGQ